MSCQWRPLRENPAAPAPRNVPSIADNWLSFIPLNEKDNIFFRIILACVVWNGWNVSFCGECRRVVHTHAHTKKWAKLCVRTKGLAILFCGIKRRRWMKSHNRIVEAADRRGRLMWVMKANKMNYCAHSNVMMLLFLVLLSKFVYCKNIWVVVEIKMLLDKILMNELKNI